MSKEIKYTSVIIRNLERSTWMKFRMICLDRDISATEMLRRLIRSFVEEYTAD